MEKRKRKFRTQFAMTLKLANVKVSESMLMHKLK